MSETHAADLQGRELWDHLDEEHGWAEMRVTQGNTLDLPRAFDPDGMTLILRDASRNPVVEIPCLTLEAAIELVSEWMRNDALGKMTVELTR